MVSDLETRIGHWFDQLPEMTPENREARRDVELVITKLDDGQLRVAEIDEATFNRTLYLARRRAEVSLDQGVSTYRTAVS